MGWAGGPPPGERAQRGRVASLVGLNLLVAASYAVVGLASTLLVRETGLSAPVWPAAGIAVAAIFLRGPSLIPGIVIGSFLSNAPALIDAWTTEPERSVSTTAILLSVAIAGALGALIGGTAARRAVGPHPSLSAGRQILAFLGLAGLLSAAVSASIGAAAQGAGGIIGTGDLALVWLTWFVGDAIGIIVFTPIILMFSPGQDHVWSGRRWQVAVPSVLALIFVTAGLTVNASLVLDQRASSRQQAANEAASAITAELERHQALLSSVVGFHQGSQFVSASEFTAFTTAYLSRHPDLQAISWNPVVPDDERAEFIALQRAQPELRDYEITERTPDGAVVPAATRAQYVPVAYIEPAAANASALGFDVASNPIRADAISRARASRTPQMTAPITLVQENGTQSGALMFEPSVDATGVVDGFGVAAYRLSDLLASTLDAYRWNSWNTTLHDVTETPVEIASRLVDDRAPTDAARDRLNVGGRTWEIRLWPTAAAATNEPPATSPPFLIGGLVILFLLEAFLLLLTGLERTARRQADTSSFEATHDELTGLLNRRGFFRNLTQVSERSDDGTESVLMYLDLDGFKAVNDTAGHDAGDELLRDVAAEMRATMRERDTMARIGGDEFAVIANNCTMERGIALAQALQTAIRRASARWDGHGASVTASIGLARIHGPELPTIDDLMRAADDACYAAKRAGGDGVRVGSPA